MVFGTSEVNNAPSHSSEHVEGLGLANFTLAEMRSLNATNRTEPNMSQNAALESVQVVETNQNGDLFSEDANGNVDSFTYVEDGEEKTYDDIKRDENGNVTGFKDHAGNVWEKQPADPTSPFPAEREGGGWMYENAETGESPRSAVELGNVTIDRDGVKADGQNADYLEIPERN